MVRSPSIKVCFVNLQRYFSGSFLIFVFIIVVSMSSCHKGSGSGPVAPDFTLSDIYGRPVSLKEYRGRLVILDFWATWCYACRISIPELIELQNTYREKGLSVVSISLDNPDYVSNKDLMGFKKSLGINYRILRGNIKVIQDYFGNQNPKIPTMFVIDRQGRIKAKIVGFNPVVLRQVLERLLE